MAGSEFGYRQLEQLWISAGGRRSLAPTMAAIAEAESGGNPAAENPSGASGLWQILGAVRPRDQAHLFDPNVNAREAVLKWQNQGLSAWQTWTQGTFEKFMQPGTVADPGVHGGQALVDEAEKFDGTPYVWGGESPKGFDCSGLVEYVAGKVGLKHVPRTSEAQWAFSQHISRHELKPGDLVFWASDGSASSPGHVAIYAGNGEIIQAEHTGTQIGKFSMASMGPPSGFGRLPGLNGASFTGTAPGGGGGQGLDIQTVSLWGWIGSALGRSIPGLSLFTDLGQLGNIGAPLGSIANALARLEHGIEWFFVPSHWVRIMAFLVGVPLVGMGVATMTKGAQPIPVQAYGVSTEVSGGSIAPALGIAEVTVGAVFLFIAFHNLDAQGVNDFPGVLSYLQGSLQRGGAAPAPEGNPSGTTLA
jgi:cell wall-associated NlpC family hydrolase